MSPSDLFLAAVLLSAPAGAPEPTPPAERWEAVQAAVHEVAVKWELLDPRETRYVLARAEDFQADLDFLRQRRADLEDAPKLSDAVRLPDKRLTAESLGFNRAFRKNLDARLVWEADRASALAEVVRETDRLYRMWDAIREAGSDCHYVTYRRQALRKLRDAIGTEAYHAGELPPCVPEWRFAAAR
jgi:hypothetical protein